MKIRKITINFILIMLFAYFLHHLTNGEKSIFALIKIKKELAIKKHEFDLIHSERLKLEQHVSLISSKSLDLDFLDEQARKILGYSKKNEIVYFYK